MLFVCYPKCSTCKKAEKWLKDQGVSFELRDIKENNPNAEELKAWHEKSGLPLKRFFNTSGMIYRQMELKDKLDTMSEDEQYDLLATDGMLVKRPLMITEDKMCIRDRPASDQSRGYGCGKCGLRWNGCSDAFWRNGSG